MWYISKEDYIAHYGVGHLNGGNSGRYPWGSGERPYQGAVRRGSSDKIRVTGVQNSKLPTYKHAKVDQAHIIPKGTTMWRVVSDPNKNESGSTYVTFKDADRNFYKDYIRRRDKKGDVYEKEYKLKEDLVVPSLKEYNDTLAKVLKANPDLLGESVESYLKQLVKIYTGVKLSDVKEGYEKVNKQIDNKLDYKHGDYINYEENKDGTIKVNNLENDKSVNVKCSVKELNDWYSMKNAEHVIDESIKKIGSGEVTSFQFGSASLGGAPDLKNAIIKELKSQGYNAMVDQAGVGVMKDYTGYTVRDGDEPLIIFDMDNSLDQKNIRKVTEKDSIKSMRKYNSWKANNRYRQTS